MKSKYEAHENGNTFEKLTIKSTTNQHFILKYKYDTNKGGVGRVIQFSFNIKEKPIHIAAREGYFDIVRFLIRNQPELLNEVDAHGQTPLIWAASRGHLPIVNYLLEQSVLLNAASQNLSDSKFNGYTALHWATERGYEKIVAALIGAGANTSFATEYSQSQPIHIAAREGYFDIVRLLIKNKPELLNAVDAHGQTPLIWAASRGHLPIVNYLLEQSVLLNAASQNLSDSKFNGYTALHWATERGYEKNVAALIGAGANTSLSTERSQFQPIHIAARDGYFDIVHLLIKNKPELLNAVDAYGQTPFIWAASRGHLPIVNYLLEQQSVILNASSQSLDDKFNGYTALHWAIENGHEKILAPLIKAGATTGLLTQKDNQGCSVLDMAFSKKNPTMLRELLEAIITNTPDMVDRTFIKTKLISFPYFSDYNTLLRLTWQSPEIVESLLKTKGSEWLTNDTRSYCFKSAVKQNNQKIIKLFLQYGVNEPGLAEYAIQENHWKLAELLNTEVVKTHRDKLYNYACTNLQTPPGIEAAAIFCKYARHGNQQDKKKVSSLATSNNITVILWLVDELEHQLAAEKYSTTARELLLREKQYYQNKVQAISFGARSPQFFPVKTEDSVSQSLTNANSSNRQSKPPETTNQKSSAVINALKKMRIHEETSPALQFFSLAPSSSSEVLSPYPQLPPPAVLGKK